MTTGPRLVPTMAALGFSAVMELVAELAEIGTANGGLLLSGDTMLVVGASVMMAYAPRTEVLPFLKGSQAKPMRGWKLRLLCWYGCPAVTRAPVSGSMLVKRPMDSDGDAFHA